MKRLFAVLMILIGVVSGVFALNLFLFIETPSGQATQTLKFERGTPLKDILNQLQEKGVVSNQYLFKAYLLWKRSGSKIRAGEYEFHLPLKPQEILSMLLKGDFATYKITLVEGWTLRQIATYLEAQKLVSAEAFLAKCADPIFIQQLGLDFTKKFKNSDGGDRGEMGLFPRFEPTHPAVPGQGGLEGYLFPDTYKTYRPKDEEELIRKFVERFRKVFTPEFEARAREMGLSQNDVVTLASIVEKETADKTEKPLVASVFLNRLKKGMALATDPTIIYGIHNFSGDLKKSDLERPGPYNTYLNVGLPPTPISNPGLGSLKAVLFPAQTNYFYFVSKNDGTHYFSKTGEEHQQAVRQYQSARHHETDAETLPGE